jgi:hypothetical protein
MFHDIATAFTICCNLHCYFYNCTEDSALWCYFSNAMCNVLLSVWKIRCVRNETMSHSEQYTTHTNKELVKYAATPSDYSQRCIITDYFNNYNFSKLK